MTPGGSDPYFAWVGPRDEAIAHLAGCDVAVHVVPVAREGAGRTGVSVYLREPEGSLLEFISYDEEQGT